MSLRLEKQIRSLCPEGAQILVGKTSVYVARPKAYHKGVHQGSPGGWVVKNPPARARDTGLISGPGTLEAAEQLSPGATTTEPVLWRPGAVTTEAHEPKACASQQDTWIGKENKSKF